VARACTYGSDDIMIGDEQTIVIQDNDKGKRIDKSLSEFFQSVSRMQLKESSDGSLIFVNGIHVPAKYV
jgi:hypothetical protein